MKDYCKRCNRKNCKGYYLLHEEELSGVPLLKEKELRLDKDIEFDLKVSPSSGEVFTVFWELHMLKKEGKKNE